MWHSANKNFIAFILAIAACGMFFAPAARAVVPVHCPVPSEPCRTWDIALSGDLGDSLIGLFGGLLGSLGPGLGDLIADEREAWFISKEAFEPTGKFFSKPLSSIYTSIVKQAASIFSWDSIQWF